MSLGSRLSFLVLVTPLAETQMVESVVQPQVLLRVGTPREFPR